MKMKAVVIYEAGGPEQLKVETKEIPKVKEGWTLVKIKGFGINRSEIFTREGHSPSVKFPRILGIECVGEIEETTSSNLKKGQKIVFIHGKGEGILRNAIINELRYKYKQNNDQDASFQEYGYGATQVTIK